MTKKKHISNIFNSKPKKYTFYYKPRNFFKLNTINFEKILNYQYNSRKTFGLISCECLYLKIPPLLACIKYIKKMLKLLNLPKTTFNIYLFPDFVITSKPREVRMGGGKGEPAYKVCLVKKGAMLVSLSNLKIQDAFYILQQCSFKLPFKSRITSYSW